MLIRGMRGTSSSLMVWVEHGGFRLVVVRALWLASGDVRLVPGSSVIQVNGYLHPGDVEDDGSRSGGHNPEEPCKEDAENEYDEDDLDRPDSDSGALPVVGGGRTEQVVEGRHVRLLRASRSCSEDLLPRGLGTRLDGLLEDLSDGGLGV